MTFDILDVFALFVLAVLFAAVVAIVVALGSLPGAIARKRGHRQATAVTAASWLGLATGGILWPLARSGPFGSRLPPKARPFRHPVRPLLQMQTPGRCPWRRAWKPWKLRSANSRTGRKAANDCVLDHRLLRHRGRAFQAEAC